MLLQKGLGYAHSNPHPPDYDDALQRLARHYRLKHFFRDQDDTDETICKKPPFIPKSTWIPPRASPQTETYIDSLPTRLDDITTRPHRYNLRKSEIAALRELQKDHTIVIKKADKGSCIVVEDTSKYVEDGMQHLSDTNIYQELPTDPTPQLAHAINTYTRTIHKKGRTSSHSLSPNKSEPNNYTF